MSDDVLECPAGHTYLIRSGIPRFVEGSTYADAFGAQWLAHRRTQLDTATGTTISADRLRRCLGPSLVERLPDFQTLEAGCGAGRFTEVLLADGAHVTSVDLSAAVDANAGACPPSGRHRLAQADIAALPFADRSFDLVMCLGVIQHTPNPESSLAFLYAQVRPGGHLVIDHYVRRWHSRIRGSTLFRLYARGLPPERSLRLSERLVDALRPLHRRARSSGGRAAMKVLLPSRWYGEAYPQLDDHTRRQWEILDTHDILTDRYKHLRTARQIEVALERLGAERVEVWLGGNGIEARCQRPAAG